MKHVYAHIRGQSEAEREAATTAWLESGGVLVVDDTGDVGRNFQDANLAFHVRLPSNPNMLEQRIGRMDRYGHQQAATQFVMADDDPEGILTSWLKVLVKGFEIFDSSISALQEAVDDLVDDLWIALLADGVDDFVERSRVDPGCLEAREAADQRTRRARVELRLAGRRRVDGQSDRALRGGHRRDREGLPQTDRRSRGIPVRQPHEQRRQHLVQPGPSGQAATERAPARQTDERRERAVRVLRSMEGDRTHSRLFRRGNPFMDGIETLLNLDDRGQAVAMWRLNRRWPHEPLVVFGFDFVVEAALDPIVNAMADYGDAESVARRRADTAFPPQHQRVWIPTQRSGTGARSGFRRLSRPTADKERGDVNLNLERIPALHTLLGGEANLASVAEQLLCAARQHVEQVADVVEASRRAGQKVSRDTEKLIAQSRARAQAAGLVMDPASLGGRDCDQSGDRGGRVGSGGAGEQRQLCRRIRTVLDRVCLETICLFFSRRCNRWPEPYTRPPDSVVSDACRRTLDALPHLGTESAGWRDMAGLIRQVLITPR